MDTDFSNQITNWIVKESIRVLLVVFIIMARSIRDEMKIDGAKQGERIKQRLKLLVNKPRRFYISIPQEVERTNIL